MKKNKAAAEVPATPAPESKGVMITFLSNPEKMPRGQRAVILGYLAANPEVTFSKLLEDLYPTYLKLINSYALEHGGVALSVRYHLRHLERGGNIKVEGTVPLAPRTPRAARLPQGEAKVA